jgi:hypothetical protein
MKEHVLVSEPEQKANESYLLFSFQVPQFGSSTNIAISKLDFHFLVPPVGF